VFWIPTYLSQYLGFSSEESASVFTATTFIISFTSFAAIFIYEKLNRNVDKTILIMFSAATLFFALTFLIRQPVLNIIFLILAIMSSNASATMLYSVYCPSLRDTGRVSTATGYLDFISYMSAAISTKLFSNAAVTLGWKSLIAVWGAITLAGVVVALPHKKTVK